MNRVLQSFWPIVSWKADLWHNTHFLLKCFFLFFFSDFFLNRNTGFGFLDKFNLCC